MKRHLVHNLPVVIGAAFLLTGGTGAAAYALVGSTGPSPATTGNTLPIDNNHAQADDVTVRTPVKDRAVQHEQPEAGDDRGGDATARPRDRRPAATTPSRTHRRVEHTTAPASHRQPAAPARQEDHSGSGHSGSGHSGSDGSGSRSGGGGSDDGGGHS